jgi:hypothetical protein
MDGAIDYDGRVMRQHNHVCLVQPGTEMVMTDDMVYDCNRWDPIASETLARREKRRRTLPSKEGSI